AQRIDAERLAHAVVERHQRVAEAEHGDRDDREAREQPAVLLAQRHRPMSQNLAMMPTKKARATVARISAVRAFLLTSIPAASPAGGRARASQDRSSRASPRLPRASAARWRRSSAW